MDWPGLVAGHARPLVVAATLGAESIPQLALKVAFAVTILPAARAGAEIQPSQVADLLEDLALSMSDEEALETLLHAGLIREVDGRLLVPTTITAGPLPLKEGPVVDVNDFVAFLTGSTRSSSDNNLSAARCNAALADVRGFATHVALEVKRRRLPGVPVFWSCSDNEHVPFAPDPGTVTTADSLRLLIESARFGFVPQFTDAERKASEFLLRLVLRMQHVGGGWNQGSFTVPAWDDDFPGVFTADDHDRGPCPTVDGAVDALIALCAARRAASHLRLNTSTRTSLTKAVRLTTEFLLRSQLRDGGWPLYRYENDEFEMPSRDVSSRFAVEALAFAAGAGCLTPTVRNRAKEACRRFVSFARRTRQVSEDGTWYWMPNFVRPSANEAERLYATATIWLAVAAIGETWPGLTTAMLARQDRVLSFVARSWTPDPNHFVKLEFRVPTWRGPADLRVPWEVPLDPVVVSLVEKSDTTAAALSGLELSAHAAMASFLERFRHGHWNDFLAEKEGQHRAMPGSTLTYSRALLDHMRAEARFFLEPTGLLPALTNQRES